MRRNLLVVKVARNFFLRVSRGVILGLFTFSTQLLVRNIVFRMPDTARTTVTFRSYG